MESKLIQYAIFFAKDAHKGQVRKYTGEPYFNHCEAVAKLVEEKGGSEAQIAAAYLHDTVEDTDRTLNDIFTEFGDEVGFLVNDLTDVFTHEAFPNLNRAKRKELEAKRLGRMPEESKLVKWCDLADNTSSIVSHDPGFAKIYLVEKARCLDEMGFIRL